MAPIPLWINPQQWRPIDGPVRNTSDRRSAKALLEVSRQFRVSEAQRYRPSPGITWCNIFLWDVTRALACEIPHLYEGRELTANLTVDWLATSGPLFGWRALPGADVAERDANAGLPTVAVWKNPKGHGHVGLCVPTPDGFKGLHITQAGGSNFDEGAIAKGFGKINPLFYGHL